MVCNEVFTSATVVCADAANSVCAFSFCCVLSVSLRCNTNSCCVSANSDLRPTIKSACASNLAVSARYVSRPMITPVYGAGSPFDNNRYCATVMPGLVCARALETGPNAQTAVDSIQIFIEDFIAFLIKEDFDLDLDLLRFKFGNLFSKGAGSAIQPGCIGR